MTAKSISIKGAKRKSGGLWFSSNWDTIKDTIKTVEQAIRQGMEPCLCLFDPATEVISHSAGMLSLAWIQRQLLRVSRTFPGRVLTVFSSFF
jgi:hypothetical protein